MVANNTNAARDKQFITVEDPCLRKQGLKLYLCALFVDRLGSVYLEKIHNVE
jgi:hypothetical protein